MKYPGRIMSERLSGVKKDTSNTKIDQFKTINDKEVELQNLAELKGLCHDDSEAENENIVDR